MNDESPQDVSKDRRNLSRETILVKSLDGGVTRVLAKFETQSGISNQAGQLGGERIGVARRMPQGVMAVVEQLQRPFCGRDDDRFSDAHRLRNGETERLRPRARMDHDVESAVDVRGVALKRQ